MLGHNLASFQANFKGDTGSDFSGNDELDKRWVLLFSYLWHAAYCSLSPTIFICIYVLPAGKFVAIHGTVIRVSNVKPLVKKMAFSCNLCSETQVGSVFICCSAASLLSTTFSLLFILLHSLPFFIQVSTTFLLSLPSLLPCSVPSPYLLNLNPLPASLPPLLPFSLLPCFPPSLPLSLPSLPNLIPRTSYLTIMGQEWGCKIRPWEWGCSLPSLHCSFTDFLCPSLPSFQVSVHVCLILLWAFASFYCR